MEQTASLQVGNGDNDKELFFLASVFGCSPIQDGLTVLHYACAGGSVSLIQTLIREHKADVNARDEHNNTPLNVAAGSGKAEVAMCLIREFGSDPNVRGQVGRSVLHHACEGGSVSLVQTLIREHKADVNARDEHNNTPLNVAAGSGKAEVALCLIREFGCDPNVRGHFGRSVLHNACEGGSVSLVQTLIREHKADVNARDEHNNTPLNVAAGSGKAEVALCLIREFGCDPNVKGKVGRSVLHHACEGGSVSLVQTLIREHKADVNARDEHNNTPLNVAAFSGKAEVALCLIGEFGCDPNVKGKVGRSVLHHACEGGSVSLVQTLIREHKADVNARDEHNNTPLNGAAFSGKAEVALCLIGEFGCDPNVKGKVGRSVLHHACEGGSVSLVQTLIREHKADVNARDEHNNTPLNGAAFSGKAEVAVCLIREFGCDPNVRGHFGRSVLHNACEGGSVSLVQTLIREHKADVNARDEHNNTPLNVAAFSGKAEVAVCLIREFGCDPNVRGRFGRSVLHNACEGGSVSLVQTLIREHKADVNARDEDNDTPLNVAAFSGKTEVALCLIREFGCDPNVRGRFGRSVLHNACQGGSVSLVQTLIREHKADVNACDEHNNTPLNVAAFSGEAEVALCLIRDFGCDPNVRGRLGRSVLHNACEGGCVSLVQTLIREHKADVNARDEDNDTPLNVAAFSGEAEVALCLIREFGCDPNVRGQLGRSVLHNACEGGSVSLVQTLIREHKADVYARGEQNNTPLHLAALNGNTDLTLSLITQFGCDHNVLGLNGKTLLHSACQGGSVSLVQTLIEEYGADVDARDHNNDPPLSNALLSAREDVAFFLMDKFGCDITMRGYLGQSLLHFACHGGSLMLVRRLIEQQSADLNARDDSSYTPLHVAAYYGRADVALSLINEFGCDVYTKGYLGKTLLHCACEGGSVRLVQFLLPKLSVLCVDDDGNTPLHICSYFGHSQCVEALLSANAPPLIRDVDGRTPLDVARRRARVVLDQYLIDNHEKLRVDYNALLELAKKRHSGEKPITRLFVIGNPGAGKSSLVESQRREGFFQTLKPVSESSVPPHTAGIVPSIHASKHYGRVMFYDFAGDPEYYSSHAAILENLAFTKVGDNLIVIVVDLTATAVTIDTTLEYWLSFIEHQKFKAKIKLAIVGSHSDLLPKNQVGTKKAILEKSVRPYPFIEEVRCFMLDCRKPRSEGMVLLQRQIYMWTTMSAQYRLSEKATLLLGLLEKDFSNVIACSLQTILSHIRDCGVCLPTDAGGLYLTLSELHDIGVLLLLGDHSSDDCHAVLKCSKLTNEVHKLLFSRSAVENLQQKFTGVHDTTFNIGIVPESVLKEILPPYITTQCLSCLLYCQEIKHGDINAFVSRPPLPTNQSFFFFPALCTVGKSDVKLVTPPEHSYSIGWLARCTAPSDCFPPRFIHVLLLRLVYRFTLSVPGASPDLSPFQRRCTTWKTGVHWLMREGVECMVELVNSNKGVAVITKADTDSIENCVSVFHRIISCVMEAKAEFCHSIRPQSFLLDSSSEADYDNEDKLFAMSEVEEVLTTTQGAKMAVSVNGRGRMKRERIIHFHKLSLWDSFFPMDFLSILQYLKALVNEVYDLGLVLKVPVHCLDTLSSDFPTDTSRRRRELVRVWLNSSLEPPCWWHLVRALRTDMVGRKDLAQSIERDFGKLILLAAFCIPQCLYIISVQVMLLDCKRSSWHHSIMTSNQMWSSWSHLLEWWGPSGHLWLPLYP